MVFCEQEDWPWQSGGLAVARRQKAVKNAAHNGAEFVYFDLMTLLQRAFIIRATGRILREGRNKLKWSNSRTKQEGE